MAFAYTVDYKIPLLDGHGKHGPLFLAIGTFTNGAGDTGGEIDTEGALVLYANVTCGVSEAATVPLTVINSATDGSITITTVANEDGVWMAVCKGYS